MIKYEIQNTQQELSRLKAKYKKLVSEIKERFYDKVDYWEENSPRKPRGDKQIMQAAICLLEGVCPNYNFQLDVRRAEEWVRGGDNIPLDYYYTNQDKFDYGNGIPPTIIIKKKNLKLLKEFCKKAWLKAVDDGETTLGLNDWVNSVNIDKLFSIICNSLNNHKTNRVHLITDRNLYIKDIVIIYPR